MSVLPYYHWDLNRNDGTLRHITQAPENSFSYFFCVRKDTFLRKSSVLFTASVTNIPRDLRLQHLSVSVSLITLFFLIQSIWLSTFQFTKKHESSWGRKNQNNFFSFLTCLSRLLLRKCSHGSWLEPGKEVTNDDLFFMNWVIYLSILSFCICFFI